MSMLNVSCPSCGFSRQVPSDKVPDGPRRVTCPRCKGVFEFTRPPATAQDAEPPPAPIPEQPLSASSAPHRVARPLPRPLPPSPSRSKTPLIVAACIIPVVLLVVLAVSLSGKLRETALLKGSTQSAQDGEFRVIDFPPAADAPADTANPAGGETPSASPGVETVPATADEPSPDNVHIFIYAVNYSGTVTANGSTIQNLGEKPDMQYNYNLMGKGLRYGLNRIEVDFSEIQVPNSSLLEIHIKISRNTTEKGKEVLGDWRFSDKGSGRKVFDFDIPK